MNLFSCILFFLSFVFVHLKEGGGVGGDGGRLVFGTFMVTNKCSTITSSI